MVRTIPVSATALGTGGALRVVLVGLGPIGKNVADECARGGPGRVVVAGAVDRDPGMVGRTLGELWGEGREDGGVRVVGSVGEVVEEGDVAVVSTTSRLETLEPQIGPILERGLHVVSSSEELFYPWLTDNAAAERIDRLARARGKCVTGAGINPGFLMDVLPAALAVASGPPHRVVCERYVDLTTRRLPLQKKAGIGMTEGAFRALADERKIGHVGLVESVAYLAGQLGIAIVAIEESLGPVLADRAFEWQGRTYEPGTVVGFEHQARAWEDGGSRDSAPLRFYLRMSYLETDSRDRVSLSGAPPIDLTIRPCTAGDPATAAVLVHLAARMPGAPAGLRMPHELGLVPRGPHYRVSMI